MELSDRDLDELVEDYLKRTDLKDNDDPLSHAAKLLAIAYEMPGVRAIQPDLPPWSNPPEKSTAFDYIKAVAEYLHAVNPTLSINDWARLYNLILVRCRGGEWVRVRSRPKQAKMIDAARLTFDAWHDKYGMARSHYYKLRKEAHEMRLKDAERTRPIK